MLLQEIYILKLRLGNAKEFEMNNRVLFYAFTPFEVISSIAIKINHFQEYEADIVLDDSILMRDTIRNNSGLGKVFNLSLFCNRSDFFHKHNNRINHEINRIKATIDPLFISRSIKGLTQYKYDYFVTTEVDYVSESIYSMILKNNSLLEVCLMDEGYSSYTYYFRERYAPRYKNNIIKKFFFDLGGKISGRQFIAKRVKTLYLYEPKLQCWDQCPYEVKKIFVNKKNIIKEINEVFGYDGSVDKEYDRKYIYFEESFFWGVRNNNDMQLIDLIASNVGEDNIIVKLHPRNLINRFVNKGFKTNKGTGIPWELIAINLDDTCDKCFISFSSGAVLNYRFIVDKSFKTILLYKCIGDEFYHVSEELKRWFEKFTELYPNQIIIPETKEELINILMEKE